MQEATNKAMSTERKPLLSNGDIDAAFLRLMPMPSLWTDGAMAARDQYENFITNGVLRVVEGVELDENGDRKGCGWDSDHIYPFSKCCPGCGQPIKRP